MMEVDPEDLAEFDRDCEAALRVEMDDAGLVVYKLAKTRAKSEANSRAMCLPLEQAMLEIKSRTSLLIRRARARGIPV